MDDDVSFGDELLQPAPPAPTAAAPPSQRRPPMVPFAPLVSRKRPLTEKLDFAEGSESEASIAELSMRNTVRSRSKTGGGASMSGGSGRRRRSRHSHSSQSLALPPLQPRPQTPIHQTSEVIEIRDDDDEQQQPPSESLNMNLGPGAGVFRDRIESEDADPNERSTHQRATTPPPTTDTNMAPPAPRTPVLSAEDIVARQAMTRAGLPRDSIRGLLGAEASVEMSESRLKYAVPLHALYERDACPICEESATSLHREAQLRISGTMAGRPTTRNSQSHQEEVAQTIQARTALVKNELRKHELLFKLEAELRGRIPDRRIAVYLLRMRRRTEREMEDAHIHYVRWTIEMLMAHFNIFKGHVRDQVRTTAYLSDLVLRQIPRIADAMYVPSLTTPGAMVLDVRATKSLEAMVKLSVFMEEKLTALQNTVDPNAVATLRAITGVINSYTTDDTAASVTVDPEASAGMGSQQQAAANSNGGAQLGPSSAKSIYEINAL